MKEVRKHAKQYHQQSVCVIADVAYSMFLDAEACIFREICASVPKEWSAIPLETRNM